MLAVVTLSNEKKNRRRIELQPLGKILHVSVGSGVSQRRLRKALKPFDGAFLCAEGITVPKLKPFDTQKPLEALLWQQFCDFVLNTSGIHTSVGVIDPLGERFDDPLLTKIVAHCALVTVFTFKNADTLCQTLLSNTGTCPEIVQRKAWLFGCDHIFAPQGLLGFEGTLFGNGGRSVDEDLLEIEPIYQFLLRLGINKTALYCMLNTTKNQQTQNYVC